MKKSSSDISAGNAATHEAARHALPRRKVEGRAANRAAFPVAAGYQLARSTSE